MGPGGQAPPPLGAHQMQYRGMMHAPYVGILELKFKFMMFDFFGCFNFISEES